MSDITLTDSFESWRHCITVKCKIELNPPYVEERISELKNLEQESTIRFISLYGKDHYRNVLNWFEQLQTGR